MRSTRRPQPALEKLSRAPTIRDVARHADVSVATVSRVLNRPELVSPDVVQRVHSTIRLLEYIPNGSARALASRATRMVAAVMPTIDGAIYSKMISAMQQAFERRGFVLSIAAHEYSLLRELESVRALIERGVDAIILVGKIHDPAVYDLIRRKRIPLLLMCVYEPDGEWPTVGWSNRAGGMRIANYLVDIGHRNFGIISGIRADNDRAADRVDGFVAALKSRDLDIPEDCIVQCRYDLAESANALRHLLAGEQPPTAILCGNDVLATGALLECLRLGIRVPQDVSIAGYDDLPLAAHLVPPLTTLRIPAEQIGRLSAETVIGLIENHPTPHHVNVEVDLILRGTTAPAGARV
ncbi:LacI family DNA-binding transcriptional regulator [Rhodoligotrophos ferricapiens]|uniref:LacI family DNA-binding transcriptional regulator n=1 Tax=Rhodoligotrophos ferricapiens TaxID=3069264 RepID=UPI00315D28B7